MNKLRICRRNGRPVRAKAGPHAVSSRGNDNVGARKDLFGEPLGDEIIEAVEKKSAAGGRLRGRLWRAGYCLWLMAPGSVGKVVGRGVKVTCRVEVLTEGSEATSAPTKDGPKGPG